MKEMNYKLIAKKGKKYVKMLTCCSIEELNKKLKESLENDKEKDMVFNYTIEIEYIITLFSNPRLLHWLL